MRSFGQEAALAPSSTTAVAVTAPMPAAKEIPYDYVARFQLRGVPGNRVQDVINVSVEGAFVAGAIGYSFIPAPLLPLPPGQTLNGILNPVSRVVPAVLNALGAVAIPPEEIFRCLAARLCGIDFRYSIVDSASGRELQNQPIHNIAGLGEAAGNRPFRPFAKPMLFLPRSTIRIEVEEVSQGNLYGYVDSQGRQFGAELYIVLHGYKILGYAAG
jgi:hypothetical protein